MYHMAYGIEVLFHFGLGMAAEVSQARIHVSAVSQELKLKDYVVCCVLDAISEVSLDWNICHI